MNLSEETNFVLSVVPLILLAFLVFFAVMSAVYFFRKILHFVSLILRNGIKNGALRYREHRRRERWICKNFPKLRYGSIAEIKNSRKMLMVRYEIEIERGLNFKKEIQRRAEALVSSLG